MTQEIREIVNAAIALYKEDNAEGVTYRRIEERLSKKEGYCFMYFDHKADLISACVEYTGDQMVELMAQILREKGAVVGRFLAMDKALREHMELIALMSEGLDRNLEEASLITKSRQEAYRELEAALEVFITDGNAQGIFHTGQVKEKAAFIAYGLLGLRSCCGDEQKKQAAFYDCMASILNTDMRTYLKLVA